MPDAGRKECRRGKEGPSREQKQSKAGSRLSRKQGGVVGVCQGLEADDLGGLGLVDSVQNGSEHREGLQP